MKWSNIMAGGPAFAFATARPCPEAAVTQADLLQLATFRFRTIKYWSGLAGDRGAPASKM
jgi:hypothetical protein